MQKPNVFIAGVPKGGTTALAALLAQHPDIFVPDKKEPRYFLFRGVKPSPKDPANANVIWDYPQYLSLYENRTEKILIDGSPGYFGDEESLKEIKKKHPEAKIILLLRDPVERAYSHFIFSQKKGFEPLNIDIGDALSNETITLESGFARERPYFEIGYYDRHLNNLYRLFPPKNIFIETSERFKKEQKQVLEEIEDFLGVERFTYELEIGEKAKSGLPENDVVHTLLQKIKSLRRIVPKAFRPAFVKQMVNSLENKNLEKPDLSETDRKKLKDMYAPSMKILKEEYQVDILYWKNFKK